MKRTTSFILLTVVLAVSGYGQTAGTAGSFARMGFGARGVGMGNALTAVLSGDVSTYYNPAVSAFAGARTVAASSALLSLDRHINYLSYTQSLHPTAGLSAGLINAGVSNIDGRDNDGVHTEDYSTYENQFYLSFSNKVDERVSLGVTVKLYNSKLFDGIKSTTVGFDVGMLVRATDDISIGAAVQDINSKYKWDTKSIYDENGKSTEDKFPNLRRIGIAYRLPSGTGVVSAEFENSSEKTNILRVGAEYLITENFSVRGGIDRWDLSDKATGAKPAVGFTITKPMEGFSPSLTYTYSAESFAPRGIHIITLSTEL